MPYFLNKKTDEITSEDGRFYCHAVSWKATPAAKNGAELCEKLFDATMAETGEPVAVYADENGLLTI